MIPASLSLQQEIAIESRESLPSKTYRLDFKNKRILGHIDGREAVMQFVQKVMSIDKYAYMIYNWYYGNEVFTLIGLPYDYVTTDCRRIVKEALMVDDRILDVTDFQFTQSSADSLTMSCLVKTVYGNIDYSQEVML